MASIRVKANALISLKSRFTISDRDILGDLLQPCDANADYILGNNYYSWYYLIGKLFQPKDIAEMGTRFGYSLKAIMEGTRFSWSIFSLAVVDDQRDGIDSLSVFIDYFSRYVPVIDVCREDTQKLTQIPGVSVTGLCDLVHVDAWHTEEGCYHECMLAHRAVKPGGVILVDDTNPGAVRDGAERFCRDKGLEFAFLPTARGMHIIQA